MSLPDIKINPNNTYRTTSFIRRKILQNVFTSGEGWRRPRVAAMPVETPMMPRAFPRRAVGCADRPPSAPIQHSEDAR